ncbi:MFS transporter [Malaciobacter marinus]|uniref:MFS transporter n=1 Tax=Malaciobacter marinus TaxID=505249 RepID=UPI003B002B1D
MLYTTQFIPLGFFFGAIPAILATNGVSMETIGTIYMLGLIWVIKFLWAPFIDKNKISFLKGHYRSWLIVVQILLSLSMFICSFYPITSSFTVSLILILFINFFSSTQDICVDGLVVNSIKKEQLQYANSMQTAGTFLGSFIGLCLPLYSYEVYTWKVTLSILSVFVISPTLLLLFYKEKINDIKPERVSYFKILGFLGNKKVLKLLLIMTPAYFVVEGSFSLIQQLLIKNEWTLIQIAISQNIIGSFFGIFAAFLSGYIMGFLGKYKSYFLISTLILFDIIVMINLELFVNNHILTTLFLSYNYFCLGLFMTLYYTFIMENSSREFAGTQVNIQHGLMLFVSLIFTKIFLSISSMYGFKIAFICLACIYLFSYFYAIWRFKNEN